MVSLVCGQKLREELSDFYHNIAEEVIEKLKNLCCIHNTTEDIICSQLLSFVIKSNVKLLTLDVIEDFEKDYLDKKAKNDLKSKTLAAKTSRTPKSNSLNPGLSKGFKALINEFNDPNPKPKLTTQIEIASNDEIIECQVKNEMSVDTSELQKTPEKTDDMNRFQDVSSMTTPLVEINDSINTSLKLDEIMNSKTLCYFGNSYSDNEWRNSSKVKHKVKVFDESVCLTEKYKFMSLKITESNEILNDIIDEFAELVKQKFDIESWGQFSAHCPTEAYYIGRVCYDCSKNKLDEHSIRFEGSSYITDNESIGLDLSRLSNYSLFAGQVMACKAINESEKTLIVQEVIDFDKIIGSPDVVPTLKQPLNLVVGVGPFCEPNSLSFEPLRKLIEYVKEYEPDFCILIGPFIDSYNEKLLTTEEPIDRLFNNQMRFVSQELMNVKTDAIIIPSTRDLNVFNVLPTMPFHSYKSEKLHYFSNPTVLNISGVIIGITSTDVLLHLSKEEISSGQQIDRLSRLCKHILNQRSFYPIFPPKPDVNVEFTQNDYLKLPMSPHLLIVPSDLKEFVKNICRSVAVNSGRVCKRKFARIRIDSIDPMSYNGSLEGYTNVEIIRFND